MSANYDWWAKMMNNIGMNIIEVSNYLYCLSWTLDWYNVISSISYKKWLRQNSHARNWRTEKKAACNLLLILLHSNVKISTYGAAKSYLIQTTFTEKYELKIIKRIKDKKDIFFQNSRKKKNYKKIEREIIIILDSSWIYYICH